MFSGGAPLNSTYHIQKGNFQACGKIIAASIAQGGPSLLSLEQCAYDAVHAKITLLDVQESDLANRK